MHASLYALKDLLAAHFSQNLSSSASSGGDRREQLRRTSVLATAQSLLSGVHYGGRVIAASNQQVLDSMLSCTVLPVVKLLLQQDGHGSKGGCDTGVNLKFHAAANIALQFDAARCNSIQQMMEAVNSMTGLDSTLELVGIEPDVAQACEAEACSFSFICAFCSTEAEAFVEMNFVNLNVNRSTIYCFQTTYQCCACHVATLATTCISQQLGRKSGGDVQETRSCLGDTHTASMWLRANGSAPESIENDRALNRSAGDTAQLMDTCKNTLAMIPDDLGSIAQQRVRCSLAGVTDTVNWAAHAVFEHLFCLLQGLNIAMPGSTETPLDTVLRSEVGQYCQLIEHIRQSLNQLQLALIGTVEMSPALQQLANDLSKKQVCCFELLQPVCM